MPHLDSSRSKSTTKVLISLITFGTPFGRYRFTHLPFGIHSASEVFQAEVASIIANLTGCIIFQDDIIVWGKTREEHDARLRSVLTRIRASGLKLNRHKCIFAATSLTFIAHCLQKVCNPIHPKLKLSYKCHFLSQSPTFNAIWAWSTTLESSSQTYRKSLRHYASCSRDSL